MLCYIMLCYVYEGFGQRCEVHNSFLQYETDGYAKEAVFSYVDISIRMSQFMYKIWNFDSITNQHWLNTANTHVTYHSPIQMPT
jgi:hypothetical protein